jgi:hypothetical protein
VSPKQFRKGVHIQPPNGISTAVTGDVQFTPTVPASRPFAKRMARSMFLVYTDAYSPNLSMVSRLGSLHSEAF